MTIDYCVEKRASGIAMLRQGFSCLAKKYGLRFQDLATKIAHYALEH